MTESMRSDSARRGQGSAAANGTAGTPWGDPGEPQGPLRSTGRWTGVREKFGLKAAGIGMVLVLVAAVFVSLTMFSGGFTSNVTVTVAAPRTGLVLNPDAKVKVRGVQIGTVAGMEPTEDGTDLELALDPDLLRLVPADATVDIRSSTVFGAKYINFVVPPEPGEQSMQPGTRLTTDKVTVEFNTLFEHLTDVLGQLEPEKLSATLTALGTALQGRGESLGQLLVNSHDYLNEINPLLPTLQRDFATTAQVADIYADASPDLLRTVDNAAATGRTIDAAEADVDTLLANITGLADTTGAVLHENEAQIGTALELLWPTAQLLDEYHPAISCLIGGAAEALPLGEAVFGGRQEGVALNTGFMLGSKPYTYPNDLPKVAATGGPRCAGTTDRVPGSHSDFVVTDTSEGHPYTPSTKQMINAPSVFQVLFAGLPGVKQP